MTYECGYCGKKYETICDRAKCELSCAAKARDEEKNKKKEALLKEKEKAFESVKRKYIALMKCRDEAEEALENYNKVYGELAGERVIVYKEPTDLFDGLLGGFWS